MNHIWSVLCQKSSVDTETNLLSIFDCIEELTLAIELEKIKSGELFIPTSFQIVSLWTLEKSNKPTSLEIKIELLDPEAKIISNFEQTQQIPAEKLRFRHRTTINGLPLTKSGRYFFKVSTKESPNKAYHEVAQVPLDVNIQDIATLDRKK